MILWFSKKTVQSCRNKSRNQLKIKNKKNIVICSSVVFILFLLLTNRHSATKQENKNKLIPKTTKPYLSVTLPEISREDTVGLYEGDDQPYPVPDWVKADDMLPLLCKIYCCYFDSLDDIDLTYGFQLTFASRKYSVARYVPGSQDIQLFQSISRPKIYLSFDVHTFVTDHVFLKFWECLQQIPSSKKELNKKLEKIYNDFQLSYILEGTDKSVLNFETTPEVFKRLLYLIKFCSNVNLKDRELVFELYQMLNVNVFHNTRMSDDPQQDMQLVSGTLHNIGMLDKFKNILLRIHNNAPVERHSMLDLMHFAYTLPIHMDVAEVNQAATRITDNMFAEIMSVSGIAKLVYNPSMSCSQDVKDSLKESVNHLSLKDHDNFSKLASVLLRLAIKETKPLHRFVSQFQSMCTSIPINHYIMQYNGASILHSHAIEISNTMIVLSYMNAMGKHFKFSKENIFNINFTFMACYHWVLRQIHKHYSVT